MQVSIRVSLFHQTDQTGPDRIGPNRTHTLKHGPDQNGQDIGFVEYRLTLFVKAVSKIHELVLSRINCVTMISRLFVTKNKHSF